MSEARADSRFAWSLTLSIARNDPGHRPWRSDCAIFCRPAKIGAPLFTGIYGGGEIRLGAKRQFLTLSDGADFFGPGIIRFAAPPPSRRPRIKSGGADPPPPLRGGGARGAQL